MATGFPGPVKHKFSNPVDYLGDAWLFFFTFLAVLLAAIWKYSDEADSHNYCSLREEPRWLRGMPRATEWIHEEAPPIPVSAELTNQRNTIASTILPLAAQMIRLDLTRNQSSYGDLQAPAVLKVLCPVSRLRWLLKIFHEGLWFLMEEDREVLSFY